MSRSFLWKNTIVGASLALLAAGCAAEPAEELTAAEQAALTAATNDAIAKYGEILPVEFEALYEVGETFVLASKPLAGCQHTGIVSGIWYDEQIDRAFDGSWFEIGSAELAGGVDGEYGDNEYAGVVSGPDLEGTVAGTYAGNRFRGQWTATVGETGAEHHGELIGRYERRSAYGGYFFGLWTECDPGPDPANGPGDGQAN